MKRIALALTLALALAAATIAQADTAYLVKDLPGYVRGHGLTEIWVTIGNTTWFKGTRDKNDVNVWKTDGTKEGTVQVTNVTNATLPHAQTFVGVLDGLLLYSGWDAAGMALFGIDTAGDGVSRVIARANVQGARPLVVRDGILYFATNGYLWRTDGTSAGTKYFDFRPGTEVGIRRGPVVLPNGFVFFGTTPNGTGLHWTSGAEETSTRILALTESEVTNDIGDPLATAGGKLIYEYDGSTRRELWASDGTAAGTVLIASPMYEFKPVGMLGDALLFEGAGPDRDEELWITDGTAEGTRVLTDLAPAQGQSDLQPGGALGSLYFFTARSRSPNNELWVTDGTPAGTRRVLEGAPGKAVAGNGFVDRGKYYFAYDDGVHGFELWESDGTTAGTRMVIDFIAGAVGGATTQAQSRPDGVIIGFVDPNDGVEPYLFDPASLVTRQLRNIGIDDPAHGSSPQDLRASAGLLFFSATLPAGRASGRSDGTHLGTMAEVEPIFHTGSRVSAAAKGRYFVGSEAGLTVSDGTSTGMTVLLQQRVDAIRTTANGVVFLAREGGTSALWASDGTVAGTKRLGIFGSFVSNDTAEAWLWDGNRVWRTDGTTAGTVEITRAGGSFRGLGQVRDAGGISYLVTSEFDAMTLWRVDGTEAHAVKTIARVQTASTPRALWSAGPYLYFVYNGVLHRSDGTEAGTFALPVSHHVPFAETCLERVLDLGGTAIVFTNTAEGTSVWRTGGSPETTTLLARTPVQVCVSGAVLGDRAYFRFSDGATQGIEPWVTDGTVAGTRLFADLHPAVLSSSDPRDFITAGDRVFFTASTPSTGRELWAIGDPAASRRRGVRK